MSRIGKIPVKVPSGVEVKVDGSRVEVKGPKGELGMDLVPGISAVVENGEIVFSRAEGREKELSPFHGLARALVQNMVTGVTEGWTRKLQVVGTGYQASMSGKKISLQVGFCNPVEIEIPEGLKVEVPQPTEIVVSGIDKQKVGELAARIRRARPPEPYKGKGIRYADEVVRRKEVRSMAGG